MTPNITLNLTITTPEAAAALLQGLGIQHPSAPPAAINPTVLPPEMLATPIQTAPAHPQAPYPPAAAPAGMPTYPAQPTAAPAATATPMYSPQPPQYGAPANAVPPTQPGPPLGQPPAYTMEDLSRAAVPLMDAGRQAEVTALLNSFGVQALTQLPPAQYGAFATALRGMGARI